jgi:hypothetical protein
LRSFGIDCEPGARYPPDPGCDDPQGEHANSWLPSRPGWTDETQAEQERRSL